MRKGTKILLLSFIALFAMSCEKSGTLKKINDGKNGVEVYKYYLSGGDYIYVAKFKDNSAVATNWEVSEGGYPNNNRRFKKVAVSVNNTSEIFSIKHTIDGYDIYKNGELKHEFTTRNTDSLSLETLKMIYED